MILETEPKPMTTTQLADVIRKLWWDNVNEELLLKIIKLKNNQ